MAGRRKETEHGTLSCGKYRGCKRPECVAAVLAYEARRRRLVGYGKWHPLVDAEPARQHLLKLSEAGCSYRSIAVALGKCLSAVTRVVFPSVAKPQTQRIRAEYSAAILALSAADVITPRVPAVGVSRRVRALNVVGWPNTAIGERIGRSATHINHIHHQSMVMRGTAELIKDCYEQLKNLDPLEHGVPVHTALTVAGKAKAQGARDPLWWDDWDSIDDPKFDPGTAERDLNRDELGELRRDEIEHLASFGCEAQDIATRLGLHLSTVRAVVQEWRTGERRDRKKAAA